MNISHQFQGFIAAQPLWDKIGPFAIPQFRTQCPVSIPNDLDKELKIPDNLVLGKRVEYFFAFYIEHFTSMNVLAQNVVIQNKVTIGEIDFILQNAENGVVNHVELVYKFYLYDPDAEAELEKWIGANRKDSMVKKLARLKNHQLPLLYREETQGILETLPCTIEKIDQKVCFKANLFVPLNMMEQTFPYVNNNCIRGYWLRLGELNQTYCDNYNFHIPQKAHWPIDPSLCEEWYSFSEIENQMLFLLHSKRSPLIWMKVSEKEFHQFFIVWW